MPARRLRLKCRYLFVLVAAALLVPASVAAQTRAASVAVKGTVSETVALSILPSSIHGNLNVHVLSDGSTVQMTLAAAHGKSPVIRVPLLVRSNTGFRISAAVESNTAELAQLSVIDVRATGALVSPAAISELEIPQQFDRRRGFDENTATTTSSSTLDVSGPLLVLSGPRVSLGGTLDSPDNALQITLFIRLKPKPTRDWLVHLTFIGTASPLTQ